MYRTLYCAVHNTNLKRLEHHATWSSIDEPRANIKLKPVEATSKQCAAPAKNLEYATCWHAIVKTHSIKSDIIQLRDLEQNPVL